MARGRHRQHAARALSDSAVANRPAQIALRCVRAFFAIFSSHRAFLLGECGVAALLKD